MNDGIVAVSIQVGTTANQPPERYPKLTLRRLRKLVEKFARRTHRDFSLKRARGTDSGTPEHSADITLVYPLGASTTPDDVVRFCRDVHKLIWRLLTQFYQNWVSVRVELSVRGQPPIVWHSGTRRGTPLADPPFLFPGLIARKLAFEGVFPRDGLNLAELYRTVAMFYAEIFQSDLVSDRVPGVWRIADSDSASAADIAQLLVDPAARAAFDASIVKLSADTETAEPSFYQASGEFLRHFQRASDIPVYYVPQFARLLAGDRGPIALGSCPYVVGAGCCEGSLLTTLGWWLLLKDRPETFQRFLRLFRGPQYCEAVARSMIGMNVVTATPHGLVTQRRSMTVGSYPGLYMLIPAGQLQPTKGLDQPSLFWTFIHELDEEMFGGPEDRDISDVMKETHIETLEGRLTYLGYGVELMNVHVVLWLLFEPSSRWWSQFRPRIELNWEHEGKRPKYVSLDQPDVDLVPSVYAGLDLVRRTVARR